MLDGCIYVSVKGEKLSTLICAAADLDNFLEKLSALSPDTQFNGQSTQVLMFSSSISNQLT